MEEIEELIKKAQNQRGNPKEAEEAFNKLIEKYEKNLYKIAFIMTENIEDTEDIVQASIIKAFNKIHQLENPKAFKKWIETILINKCKKLKSYKNKLKEVPLEYYYKESETKSSNTISKIESKIDFGRWIKNSKELTEIEILILTLHYKEGFKLIEISKMLDMNYNTIKTNINKIKQKYQKRLEGINGQN